MGADVVDAVVGILGDEMGGADRWRVVPARRGNRHRNAVQILTWQLQLLALEIDFVHRRSLGWHFHGRDRICLRFGPELIHLPGSLQGLDPDG